MSVKPYSVELDGICSEFVVHNYYIVVVYQIYGHTITH